MDFESLVGTTGLTTFQNKVYIANNKALTSMDSYRTQIDFPHSFDFISSITAGGNSIFGIFCNGDQYGLFAMDVDTKTFNSVSVDFIPVSILFISPSVGLVVVDDEYRYYQCNSELITTLSGTIPITKPKQPFMTFGLTKTESTYYFCTNEQIIDMSTLEPLPLSIDGTILSIQYYLNNLFVIYISDYNHYSILQYEPVKNTTVKTIEGGYSSGPALYSCIYQNFLFISASTNKLIPMTLFDIPLLKAQTSESYQMMNNYPLFELPNTQPVFIEESVSIPTEKLKKMNETLDVDIRPAEKSLLMSYVWMFVAFMTVCLVVLMLVFQENKILPRIAILVIVGSILFILKSYL